MGDQLVDSNEDAKYGVPWIPWSGRSFVCVYLLEQRDLIDQVVLESRVCHYVIINDCSTHSQVIVVDE